MERCEARTNEEMGTYDPKAVEGDCPNKVVRYITNDETGAVVPFCAVHDEEMGDIAHAILALYR